MNFKDETKETGSYSNRCVYSVTINDFEKQDKEQIEYYNNLFENGLVRQFRQPARYFNKTYVSYYVNITEINDTDELMSIDSLRVFAFNNIDNNIEIIRGKLPSAQTTKEGYYEIAVSNDMAIYYRLVLGRIYNLNPSGYSKSDQGITVRIVGIFNPIIGGASTIFESNYLDEGVVFEYNTFQKLFIDKHTYLSSMKWDFMLDYTKIDVDDIPHIIDAHNKQTLMFQHPSNPIYQEKFSYNGIDVLKTYGSEKQKLNVFIGIFALPVFILLIFSIFFISKLIVEMDKNEISILRSRGASMKQILSMYLIQSVILVALPFLISSFLAVALCKALGNTTGFLEFGNNIPLSTDISLSVFLFDILACVCVVLTMLIPSLFEARVNIIQRKLQTTHIYKKPFWKRYCLDFIMAAISAYGYYSFTKRQQAIVDQKMFANQLPLDPLTFIIMVLFIIAAGMFLMRLYPLVIKLISRLGKRIWSASAYYSMQRVSVLNSREQFIILFLILTVSLGIFSANSARTINRNIDDYIMYNGGADVVLKLVPTNISQADKLEVRPPAFYFKNISGVKDVTILSIGIDTQIYNNIKRNEIPIDLIGIDIPSFSRVAWTRSDMNNMHLNHYLNLLNDDLNNCIISESLAEEMDFKVGDSFEVNLTERGADNGANPFNLKIVAIIDAWPSYSYIIDEDGNLKLNHLIITNNVILERQYKDLTYKVWLKTDGKATVKSIKEELQKKYVGVMELNDYVEDVYTSRNSAQRQSLNTLITLSFMVSFLICFIGFLLYWILSVKSRVLQFGILRALGMSVKSIYSILIYENLFITVSVILYSVIVGGVSSRIFSNLLKISFGADNQMLPFKFFSSQVDFVKIYGFLGAMLVIAFAVISLITKHIKIAQIIKLGED